MYQSLLIPNSDCKNQIINLEKLFQVPSLIELNMSTVGHAVRLKARESIEKKAINFEKTDANGVQVNALAWIERNFGKDFSEDPEGTNRSPISVRFLSE